MKPLLSRSPKSLSLGLFFLIGALGCGGSGFHQVRGKVVYTGGEDAAALAKGLVLFDPVDLEVSKLSARGEIQADGSFRMSTSKEGDGVAPGKYRVMVAPPPFFGGRDRQRPQLLDPLFQDFETSGLEITVDKAWDDYLITVRKP